MASLNNIVKVTKSQYQTLVNGGSITKGGVTYTYDSSAMYLIANTDEDLYITSAEFFQEGYSVNIIITNSSHTSEWVSTIVYDSDSETNEIGRFTSANGSVTVLTTTGVVQVAFTGGLVMVPTAPGITGDITLDYLGNDHCRFIVNGNGTIFFDNIDWDD